MDNNTDPCVQSSIVAYWTIHWQTNSRSVKLQTGQPAD